MMPFLKKIKDVLEMIKFSHSFFALPWALASLFFASHGFPKWPPFLLVILCMIFARNVAMTFNRLVDRYQDAKNPRTAGRHIPQGIVSVKFAKAFIGMNCLLFITTTFFLNDLAFLLSPVALAIICFYSYTKKMTHWTQIFLGFSLSLAPIGAWIAMKASLSGLPLLLGLSVLLWVAGFDILYATQDFEFDRRSGLKSLVVYFGIKRALIISRIFHILCILVLALLGLIYEFQFIYFLTIGLMAGALSYEHSLVKAHDLSKISRAFFTVNGMVSILFFVGGALEVLSRP